MTDQLTEQQQTIEQFKIKRLIKKLEESKGNGTSVISIYIPPKKRLDDITNMLNDEVGKASNVKDKINRLSIQTSITNARERLKQYNKCPTNGLVLFCGNDLVDEDGKTDKKLMIDFEPYKPINISLYSCETRFQTTELKCLLESEQSFGFIVVDGNGALFGKIAGSSKEICYSFSVDLPKKHNKGGQSSLRFARIRIERRQIFTRKVCEIATQVFISNDRPNVTAIVLAGCADFKNQVHEDEKFDPRLFAKVVKLVDTSYGGENGFNQAIELSQECMKGQKFAREKQICSKFYEEIAKDTHMVVYGLQDTMRSLEGSALETIMVYENAEFFRVQLKNKDTDSISVLYLLQDEIKNPKYYKDGIHELEAVSILPLNEWIAENYQQFGTQLEFITDKSPEGFQFVKGFQGFGGFLRYKMDVQHLVNQENDNVQDLEDDFI